MKRSWTSAITLVKLQATSSFWPSQTPGRPGREAPRIVRLAVAEADLVPEAGHARRSGAGRRRAAGTRWRSSPRSPPSCWTRSPPAPSPIAARTLPSCSAIAIPSPDHCSWVTIGFSARVGRVEPRRELRPEGAGHVGAQQLPLPVGREAERDQLAEGEDVDRLPRLELAAAAAASRTGAPGRRRRRR